MLLGCYLRSRDLNKTYDERLVWLAQHLLTLTWRFSVFSGLWNRWKTFIQSYATVHTGVKNSHCIFLHCLSPNTLRCSRKPLICVHLFFCYDIALRNDHIAGHASLAVLVSKLSKLRWWHTIRSVCFRDICVPVVSVAFPSHLHSADGDDMVVPRSHTARCGPCSCRVAAPQICNMLSSHLKDRNISREQFRLSLCERAYS